MNVLTLELYDVEFSFFITSGGLDCMMYCDGFIMLINFVSSTPVYV